MHNVVAIAGVAVKELYRRKDFYVLFILTGLITLLMGTVNFFNEDKIVRYLKAICLLLIWISSLVIAISTAARQIPAERENRTIFPLLAKPVSRTELVMGKFLGCWLACGLALVMFYVFFAVVAAAREHHLPLMNYFQAIALHWFMLAIVLAMTLLGSIVFAAPSSNGTIIFVCSAGIMLLGRHLNKVAVTLAEPLNMILYSIYYVIPHLELFDVRQFIVHDWGLIPWGVWLMALLYAVGYAAFFLGATCLAFRRKSLN